MALQKFEKLKIDTDSLAATPKSGLSGLTHEDHSHRGSLSRSDHDLSKVSGQDLFQGEWQADEGELADREDNDGIQERDFGGLGSSLGAVSELSSLEASLRNRGTAISFDSQVTLEGGYRHQLQHPLPRSDSWTGPPDVLLSPYNHEPHHHRGHSDTETSRYDSDTGEPLDRWKERSRVYYREGEPRHPLLQSTVDDLAKDPLLGDPDRIASLTSGTTASPIQEEVQTPLNHYLVSPIAVSPAELSPGRPSGSWTTKRSDSQSRRSMRSTPANSVGSAPGRTRRSSSRRSGTSANSPSVGSEYLNRFLSRNNPKPQQEDDEGQEIGDHSQYIIGKQIGKGGFSVLKEAVTIIDGEKVVRAVKIIRKQLPTSDEVENERIQLALEQEVKLWSTLNYKYILPLIEAHTTPFATYCITQLNKGGTLFDLIHNRQKLAEPGIDAYLAKRYIYQLGCAIRYLHEDMRIVHRDIKLDNCLLDMSDPRASVDGGNILLCDFGMAEYIRNDDRNTPSPPPDEHEHNIGPAATSTNVTGTLEYASPEVVNATKWVVSTAADMWSYGVCMYALVTGKYPFRDSFQPRLAILITRGTWDQEQLLRSPAVRRDGARVANLVRGCLEPEADARYTIRQALNEDWFEGCREIYDAEEPLPGWSS